MPPAPSAPGAPLPPSSPNQLTPPPPTSLIPPGAGKPVGGAPIGVGSSPVGSPPTTPPPPPPTQPALPGQPPQPNQPPTAQAAVPPKKPLLAGVMASPFKFLPIVVLLIVVAVVGYFAYTYFLGGSSSSVSVQPDSTGNSQQPAATQKATEITYWGLWEPDEAVAEVLTDFEKANPGIKVNYVKQTHKDYRERLQTAIAAGQGPDLFRFHEAWTPMLADELAAMPSSVMSASEYQKTFYPVAAQMLQLKGQIVGVPLEYDGLGLYYNREMFKTAGEQPPKTWAELKTLASRLTVRSSTGVERGGLAIGTSTNVEHFSDIIGLLLLQNGADPAEPTSKQAQEAIQFYTNFLKDGVWSESLPNSTVAFARGEAAMMFAPSWRAHEIEAINPALDYGIVQVPTLGDQRVAWATFWAEGVSSKSTHKDEAWKLIKYLSSADVMKKLYSQASKVRSFGEPYSRTELASQLNGDDRVAPFLQDAPMATSWYLASFTHDNGLNDQLIKYYADAVTAINLGGTPDEVMATVDQGTKQILRQYGAE